MIKIVTLLSIASMFLALSANAQNKLGTVSGIVIDGSRKTIEASTITLIRSKDSSIAKISAADKDGKFEFEKIPLGKYLVSVTAVGHQKGYSPSFEITAENSSIDVKSIELNPQTKSLSTVIVTAKRPLVEQKLDRTIINVEASITNVGSTALEVLEKSPG